MTELVKTRCEVGWWDDGESVQDPENVEVEISFEGDTFYIDGLREGKYLSVPLKGVAQAMADAS